MTFEGREKIWDMKSKSKEEVIADIKRTVEPKFLDVALAIIECNDTAAVKAVKALLDANVEAPEILLKGLTPGLRAVGELFAAGHGVYMTADLILAADAASSVMEVVKPLIKAGKSGTGNVIIGTVEGDVHDIGKNIVIAMFQSAGFAVNDLGVNVPAKKFVDAAANADIVAASACLGAAKAQIEPIKEGLKERGILDNVKLIGGGWGMTEEYCQHRGWAFGLDALDGLKKTEELMRILKEERAKK